MSYLRPGVGALIGNRLVRALRAKPTLTVPGRRTGEPRSVPINVLDHGGKRYLVAPRGEAEWCRNLRAAGRGELKTRRGVETFTATEVPDDAKPDIIAAYREHWEGETKRFWTALPDPADHPVFEIG